MEQEDHGTFVAGAVLVAIGVALVLDRVGAFVWTAHWSVWPLLLIGFGVANLAYAPYRVRGLFPIFVGAWLWALEAGWLEARNTWPLILVVLGVVIMLQTWLSRPDTSPLASTPTSSPTTSPTTPFETRRARRRRQRGSPIVMFGIVAAILAATAIDARRYGGAERLTDSSDRFHVLAAAGRSARTATPGTPLRGGESVTVMGETDIDLRNATMADGDEMTVDIFTMWGAAVIRVPDGWTVDVRTVPVLANIDDRRGQPDARPSRGRGRNRNSDDSWTIAPPAATPLTPGAAGSTASGDASGANPASTPDAAAAPAKHGRLVLTGTVLMGSLIIRS